MSYFTSDMNKWFGSHSLYGSHTVPYGRLKKSCLPQLVLIAWFMYYQICKVNYEVGSVDGFYNNTITRGELLHNSVCVCEMRISAASEYKFLRQFSLAHCGKYRKSKTRQRATWPGL